MPALLLRFAQPLGLAALLVILTLGAALKLQTDRLDRARAALSIEQALHATDIAQFRATQARAQADWQAEVSRVQDRNRRQNDETDRQAAAARADYLDRVMRLPAAPADPGLSGDDKMSAAGLPPGADRTGRDTLLLARSDALICAANTARLQAAHDWARGLRDKD